MNIKTLKNKILIKIRDIYFNEFMLHALLYDTLTIYVDEQDKQQILDKELNDLQQNYPNCFKIEDINYNVDRSSSPKWTVEREAYISFREDCDLDFLVSLMRMRGEFK